MNKEFGKKVEKLAQIIENRSIIGAEPGSIPTKFSFVKTEEGLQCVWTPALAPSQLSNVVHTATISKNGLTSTEWTNLTEILADFL